jgi:hypothetical protein
MMAQQAVTDRAHRYRANQLAPVDGKVCLFCGSTQFLVPDHWDGHPDHTHTENLEVLCKSCNTAKGAAFKAAGRGRLTHQYNPTKSGGAANVGEWMQAVGSITPHIDRGDRGLVSSMSTRDAVDMIRATSQSKRREYAAKMRRRNPGYVNAVPGKCRYCGKPESELKGANKGRAMRVHEMHCGNKMHWRKSEKPQQKLNPWPFSRPDARRTTPASGGIAHHTAKRRPVTVKTAASDRAKSKKAAGSVMPDEAALQAGFKRGLSLREILGNPGSDVWRSRFTAATKERAEMSRRQIAREGYRVYPVKKVSGRWGFYYDVDRKANPATASAEAFQEFHGFAPSEVITVTKKLHYHKHLAAAGELISLDVWGIDEQGHRITGFKGAFLAFNESKNQLFVEGGDQSVNLADFGIDSPHELETLGRLTDIGYHTKKTHLGDEGGEAVYVHKFRSTNRNGKHVVVKIARYPDLIYDVRNEQLLFSGGSYEIIAEGINK